MTTASGELFRASLSRRGLFEMIAGGAKSANIYANLSSISFRRAVDSRGHRSALKRRTSGSRSQQRFDLSYPRKPLVVVSDSFLATLVALVEQSVVCVCLCVGAVTF